MKIVSGTTGNGAYVNRIFSWLPKVVVAFLMVIHLASCSRQTDTTKQPAKPPEPKNQTYRMIGGQSVISLVSSDELEIRQGGENLICKYTKQDGRLRVVVNVLGTTTAKYFNMTPEGLVDEDGDTYYEPATYDKVMRQIELNRQLLAAVKRNDGDAVEELLSKGASQNTSDGENNVFTIAVEEHHPVALAVLLRHGADPNQETSSQGETALFVAVRKGYTQIVEMLIKSGARLNDKNSAGFTPLMLASSIVGGWGTSRTEQHDAIVSLLCQAGSDLNAQDSAGYTALGWSLRNSNLEAAKILVAAGADRNIGKEKELDAFSLSNNDKKKTDAIRTQNEREAREKLLAQYPKMLVGVWRDESSILTFNADGTSTVKHKEESRLRRGTWSIKEDILSNTSFSAQIIELTDSIFVFEQNRQLWHATRVPKEEIEAAQAKIEKVRQMFIGEWRNTDDGGIFTIKEDGTVTDHQNETSQQWSVDEEDFILGRDDRYKIQSIDSSSFKVEKRGCSWDCTWRGTRIR